MYQLGIDTGGTYTDAVLLDSEQRVVASNKSLTTAFDLTIGVGETIAKLPSELLLQVNLVSISTTLSTNSVVEGRGAPVAILLPGYTLVQVEKSGLQEILDSDMITLIEGGHDATGRERVTLNLDQADKTIRDQQDRVSAFAVSSMFGTRNSAHELALRKMIEDISGKPVACGHELASSLGAPRRALTTALNSRMIPFIQHLIEAVEKILERHAIDAPLMVVKGDGSLVNVKTARRLPLTTVLSGPAASVIGACALSGKTDAVVVDMGGTTTDIAIVTHGEPELSEDGARIGNWRPMVKAIRVQSIGLGGDSEVRYANGLSISERRIVPMSLLAHLYPGVVKRLERQLSNSPNARQNRFAIPLQHNAELIKNLDDVEIQAWKMLQDHPVEIDELVENNRPIMRAIARLQRSGLVIYSGFTPTDATHVLGMSDHWNRRAAELAATLWIRQMRYLYGYGKWADGDLIAPCQQVFDLVSRQICQSVIEAGLDDIDARSVSRNRGLTQVLTELVMDRAASNSRNTLFSLNFSKHYPIVAVGAPAADYFPEVSRLLGVELHLPEHAEVANAVGAVMGTVVQSSQITVTQPEHGRYCLFHNDQPLHFENRDLALVMARELAVSDALSMARAAGARSDAIDTRLRESANHVKHDIDGELFVSATITATASGRPETGKKSPA